MFVFFFQAEDGIRDYKVTGVQTCALPISPYMPSWSVMASAARPRRAASATSSAGAEAPSRKLYDEWQCSSAHAGPGGPSPEVGRAAGRGKEEISGGGASFKKKKKNII